MKDCNLRNSLPDSRKPSSGFHTTLIWIVILLLIPLPAAAETGYISDSLTVPLRSGASNAHRIINSGLPSGTVLEILAVDESAGFTQVRTLRGTEGWMRSQYLVKTPIAKQRLTEANARMETLSRQLDNQNRQLDEVTRERLVAVSENETLLAKLKSREAELAEIRRVSSNSLELNETNKQLTTLNRRLRDEVDNLVSERNLIQDNLQQKWLLIGAGLVLGGLMLGVLIKARPRRSGWS